MSVFTITPYLHSNHWVFDEPELGLVGEAFVGGATELINDVLKELDLYHDAAKEGFTLQFRAGDEEGVIRDEGERYDPYWTLCDVVLSRVDNPDLCDKNNVLFGQEGTWYATHSHGVQVLAEPHVVWLCPAVELFFGNKPKRIYVHVDSLGFGPSSHGTGFRAASMPKGNNFTEHRAAMIPPGNFIGAEDADAVDRK